MSKCKECDFFKKEAKLGIICTEGIAELDSCRFFEDRAEKLIESIRGKIEFLNKIQAKIALNLYDVSGKGSSSVITISPRQISVSDEITLTKNARTEKIAKRMNEELGKICYALGSLKYRRGKS